ncbi:phospholipid-transporting ATPase ABCA3-like [Dermacentor silvarum]|uniref:phospholipid-transporting ATPase ABCA3-like n=1 Tax=Dermacentor silvarum TaxID=543639 RepID=UPI0021013CF1|nr:phospholipid-transporting ATPase ABCA3-like [Dermacentor silvarum]
MIVLDEAMCNMESRARRETWGLLFMVLRYNGVFLTTSDLAKAEALAYYCLFFQHGEMHCVSSPEHIKTQFGKGYKLRLSQGKGYQSPARKDLICKHLPSANKVMDKSTNVHFRPTGTSEMASILMRDLFHELEVAKSKLGIAKMGLIVATLEPIWQGWVGSSGPLFHLTFVQVFKQLSPRRHLVNLTTEVQAQAVIWVILPQVVLSIAVTVLFHRQHQKQDSSRNIFLIHYGVPGIFSGPMGTLLHVISEVFILFLDLRFLLPLRLSGPSHVYVFLSGLV